MTGHGHQAQQHPAGVPEASPRAKQDDRQHSLDHVKERHGESVSPAERTEEIGRPKVAAAGGPQVDTLDGAHHQV